MTSATDNKDLVWDLDLFNQRQRAVDFVMRFENKLCVYSDSVRQLYTNYNIFFPKEENRRLVILPNPYAHHDIFHSVPEEAITPTGLAVVPGDAVGKQGLHLLIPFRSGKTRYRAVPLQAGLRIVNQQRAAHTPLLPVLKKGDLRELEARSPCLHLHSIHLNRLLQLSSLEVKGIQQVILERLASIQ